MLTISQQQDMCQYCGCHTIALWVAEPNYLGHCSCMRQLQLQLKTAAMIFRTAGMQAHLKLLV